MTTKKDIDPQPDRQFGGSQEVVTFRYRGPNRRKNGPFDMSEFLSPSEKLGHIAFDDKGNPVWQLKAFCRDDVKKTTPSTS